MRALAADGERSAIEVTGTGRQSQIGGPVMHWQVDFSGGYADAGHGSERVQLILVGRVHLVEGEIPELGDDLVRPNRRTRRPLPRHEHCTVGEDDDAVLVVLRRGVREAGADAGLDGHPEASVGRAGNRVLELLDATVGQRDTHAARALLDAVVTRGGTLDTGREGGVGAGDDSGGDRGGVFSEDTGVAVGDRLRERKSLVLGIQVNRGEPGCGIPGVGHRQGDEEVAGAAYCVVDASVAGVRTRLVHQIETQREPVYLCPKNRGRNPVSRYSVRAVFTNHFPRYALPDD